MEKTHWKKIVSDPTYIGEGDFQPGQEIIVTIDRVISHESVKTAEGKSDKAVVYFKENYKPMILNVARSKSISKVCGSPYFEDWIGHKIQLYIQNNIRAFGDFVNAVRVREFKPREYKCTDCGAIINDFGKKTAEEIARNTKDKYGKPLCANCAMKVSKNMKTEDVANETDK